MIINRKIILGNVFLALAFLIYLCVLDLLFVFIMNKQKSFINDMMLLIAAMPFIGTFLTFKMTNGFGTIKARISISLAFFLVLVVVGYIEILWVATHFHFFLGGNI
ncbi:hypothetical protein [Endozoicomonas euniceicola]|uniref:Uncharacterized protein n=1 Tax=Endozoicomonas euniceicola TaxID=1234143 RepID=A0ABY6GVF4_9GAMM|nr:hypothetical protein [Endozoicomonas euniceicola]UYM15949.1 hypothetical protein NX720_24550 [Endozoicomonas euniceicola]